MRLFVALELPKEATDELSRLQSGLKQAFKADRWQPLSNLHLTLHFLGNVDEMLISEIRTDMDIVASIIEPFTLVLGSLGTFGRPDKPKVLWVGINGHRKDLGQLQLLLGKRFDMHAELHYDRRSYNPHITLARGPQAHHLELLEWYEQAQSDHPVKWQVKAVHLYQSELRPSGAVHTIIHTSKLGEQQES